MLSSRLRPINGIFREFSTQISVSPPLSPVSTSETSVQFYRTTWPYNPEDSHLYVPHHENLKSYKISISVSHETMHASRSSNFAPS